MGLLLSAKTGRMVPEHTPVGGECVSGEELRYSTPSCVPGQAEGPPHVLPSSWVLGEVGQD